MQLHIEEKKKVDRVNVFVGSDWHFQREVKTIHFAITVPIVFEALEHSIWNKLEIKFFKQNIKQTEL